MGRIIVLDENTSNKIAAGEVVEKPASVVKELVENSIDAGATNISVDIKNGGISYIKVTDNGCGMDEDDVEIAFERHATSKIRRAEDLDSIITMGFRGEALASIAAVSSVELQTKTANSTYGMYVNISGGIVKEVRQTGCPVGTTFIIKDLFFNTPARYKFLKKDSAEAGYISDTISRIALGNPEISFKLTSGKTLLVHSPGNNDLKSVIFSIYGRDIVKDLVQVEYSDDKFSISGYIGKPDSARANRNYQSLYINKRYVKSKLVSYAVERAYSGILMKNKFPFYVLNIGLNPQQVDANVHPAKMDVRFADESYLSRSIYMAVSNALSSGTLFNPVSVPNKDREVFKFRNIEPKNEYLQETLTLNSKVEKPDLNVNEYRNSNSIQNNTVSQAQFRSEVEDSSAEIKLFTKALEPLARTDLKSMINDEKLYMHELMPVEVSENTTIKEASRLESKQGLQPLGLQPIQGKSEIKYTIDTTKAENSNSELKDMKYIGQAFSTYIILQNGSELVLVDQHAAHERILYENLKTKFEQQENTTQLLLEPIVIQLQPNELIVIKANEALISKIGFEFEDFGNNSIIVRGIPYLVEEYSPKEVFLEILEKIQNDIKPFQTPMADEVIHTLACKAAIKANKKLNEKEVFHLIDELTNTGRRYTCPHGRPTIIRLTKYEIEKMFKRIV